MRFHTKPNLISVLSYTFHVTICNVAYPLPWDIANCHMGYVTLQIVTLGKCMIIYIIIYLSANINSDITWLWVITIRYYRFIRWCWVGYPIYSTEQVISNEAKPSWISTYEVEYIGYTTKHQWINMLSYETINTRPCLTRQLLISLRNVKNLLFSYVPTNGFIRGSF